MQQCNSVAHAMPINSDEFYDVVVCGGGLAGFCAAIGAARNGASTCLIHNRPVLGGCSSSEIRVEPRGAACFHAYARESGILHEAMIEDRHCNHAEVFESGWTNSIWDMTLYDMAMKTEHLTLKLNTMVVSAATKGQTIISVTCYIPSEERRTIIRGKQFIDCTGDGIVALSVGCSWRRGEEARFEFKEPHAPLSASNKTMGNSLLFKTVDVGRDAPFTLPDWALEFDDKDFFDHQGRFFYDVRGGFWWIELGTPWDVISDGETLRHELTRRVFGVWDWLKNKDPRYMERTRTLALDWIGQVPGMRESRRFAGMYLLKESDLKRQKPFPDEVAYGGWNIDLHTPGGMLAQSSEPTAAAGYDNSGPVSAAAYVRPFGVPLRSMISSEIENLGFAGRIVSATHVALGSVRVMGTTAIIGQAIGTAASIAVKNGLTLQETPSLAIAEIQQRLLRDGCFLPDISNADADDLARRSTTICSSSQELYDGATVEDTWVDGGACLSKGLETAGVLERPLAQWIPVARGNDSVGIEFVEFRAENIDDKPHYVDLKLQGVSDLWDYRVKTGCCLGISRIELQPGVHAVKWYVHINRDELEKKLSSIGRVNGFVRLDVHADKRVRWPVAGCIRPGAMSAFEMQRGGLHRYLDGVTLNHRIGPPQPVYSPMQVISGVARPGSAVNLWRSSSLASLPATLELVWDEEQTIHEVDLTFAGNLLWEFDHYPSFWSDPQTIRDYSIEIFVDGNWQQVCEVRDNYQSHRIHRFPSISHATRLRIKVMATNGDPSAEIYEIRCY